jgi:hypothetical protein
MANLWMRYQDSWAVMPLASAFYNLSVAPPVPRTGPGGDLDVFSVGREWVLCAPPTRGVQVNGLPLLAGIHVLEDRDEIAIDGRCLFFSTEVLATMEEYTGAAVFCPRCKQAISTGQRVVRCPRCSAVHHQTEELPCFTYAPTCSLCPQLSDLNAGYQWTPEELQQCR